MHDVAEPIALAVLSIWRWYFDYDSYESNNRKGIEKIDEQFLGAQEQP